MRRLHHAAFILLITTASLRLTCSATAAITTVCAPGEPVVFSGSAVTVHAWVTEESGGSLTEAPTFRWSPDRGEISGAAAGEWKIGSVAERVTARARVDVDAGARGSGTCEITVLALPNPTGRDIETPRQRSQRLAARLFLLPGKQEPAEYGLHSYLLFLTPPENTIEQERYIMAADAYLRVLVPAEALLAYNVRASEVNLTMLPLKKAIQLPEDLNEGRTARAVAGEIVKMYNYSTAQVVSRDFGIDPSRARPHLVSRTGRGGREKLLIDMTGVDSSQLSDWMKHFCWLTSQERSWTAETLKGLSLRLRNVLAVTASTGPVVATSMAQWIYLVKRQ